MYALVDNRYDSDIFVSLESMISAVPLYFENTGTIRVGKSTKRLIRVPVFSKEKLQPNQLQGVIALSTRRGNPFGQVVLANGQSRIPVSLVTDEVKPTSGGDKEPVRITVAPKGKMTDLGFNCRTKSRIKITGWNFSPILHLNISLLFSSFYILTKLTSFFRRY